MKQTGMNPLGFSADKPNASLEFARSGSPHSRWHNHVPSALLSLPLRHVQNTMNWVKDIPLVIGIGACPSALSVPLGPTVTTRWNALTAKNAAHSPALRLGTVTHQELPQPAESETKPITELHVTTTYEYYTGSHSTRAQSVVREAAGSSSDSIKQVECGPRIDHPNSVDGRYVLYKNGSTRIWLYGQ